MRSSLSLLAAVSRGQASRLRKPTVSLDHFIQRQRVLALWRDIVRAVNSKLIPLSLCALLLMLPFRDPALVNARRATQLCAS
ncbi:hypothetical protein N7474_008387 [Penicillium riverlandense]|uniref:uncharacterized protein n=1 Tax=Penicillium riverlandense TaxID=1903569 RepID=UPI0025492965|nr:uncharacterized protein N7474_008387 [Penicillium riverlandense]KAJ5812086.1 hypothetical protein N7474_008387 [Penicillium riverlandense]